MAGDNPQAWAYISFDPAGDFQMNEISPAPFSTVNAYFCIGCATGGMTTVSFRLNDALVDCPNTGSSGMATQSFVNLMPGNLMIGNPFDAVGATIAATECMLMDPIIVGYASYFYLGGACAINILDHADYPRWVVDCNEPGLVDYYCVAGNGSVGGAPLTPGEDCPCDSPVEDTTWGGIKALYR
jgi:hypothetical protein